MGDHEVLFTSIQAMGVLLLGMTLGSVQPMIMSVLHQLTPHDRHGEAHARRDGVARGFVLR